MLEPDTAYWVLARRGMNLKILAAFPATPDAVPRASPVLDRARAALWQIVVNNALHLACAALLLTVLQPVFAEEKFFIEAHSAEGGGVQVDAHARVKARPDVIWGTLVDYNNLDRFIPGMRSSDVIERHGSVLLVHQRGVAHLLFFTYKIDVTVEVTEEPPSSIRVRLVSGNLRKLTGGYEITHPPDAGDDEYEVRWNGVIECESLPEFVAIPLMRSEISDQFRGMVDEIARRSAPQPPPAAPAGSAPTPREERPSN
jgi:ribosome-associated toxin RatA of RatAB toxin-antitoxin module